MKLGSLKDRLRKRDSSPEPVNQEILNHAAVQNRYAQNQSAKKAPVSSYNAYLKMGMVSLALLVVGMGGWASLFKIKGAVIAPGTVVVESKPKIIQHIDGGIVGSIPVKEGQHVKAGDILMALDPTRIDANRSMVQTRYFEVLARVARLEAERDNLPRIYWPEDIRDNKSNKDIELAKTGQMKLFEARRIAASGEVEQLRKRIAQFEDQIRGLESLIYTNNQQLDLMVGELDDLRIGLDRGVVTRTRYKSAQRARAALEGDNASQYAEIARIRNSISEIEVQILQLGSQRREAILTEMREARTILSDQREQLVSVSDLKQRIELRAPSSGIVHNIAVTTIGGVVAPGQEIMQIIPRDDRLIIDSQVQPQDIDQVFPGQTTTVRFSAFNQRTTPEVNGDVLNMSADRLIDPITGFPYFSVKVKIPLEEMRRLGGVTLIPGMPAEAFMQTRSRSVMSYLLKPVKDAMRHAGREE